MEPNATVICLSYGLITDWALLHVASMDHFNILELVTTQQRYSNILTSVILPLVETPNESFPTKEFLSLIAGTRLFCNRVSVFST